MSAKLKRPWIRGKVKAEVRPFQGAPTVFVNGEPIHFGSVLWRRITPAQLARLCFRPTMDRDARQTPA